MPSWKTILNAGDDHISAMAIPDGDMFCSSVAEADRMFGTMRTLKTFYGIDNALEAYRFCRVKSNLTNAGGGTVVLAAALAEIDRREAWAVLEAQPYGVHRKEIPRLKRFYERFGFREHRRCDLRASPFMVRPPGGSASPPAA